ncbi:MAG: tRNA 2-thiouridine(34) synthase MnmA [archaeon]|nr:tRNA 2-thiouridine(34) synthase MnmA [archaeon]
MSIFKKKPKEKVLLAMSGGVDSSVAALLLKKSGYDVYGAFMKNWSDTKNKITGECQWVEERNSAIKIATKLGIPFVTLDFEKEYKKLVVDEMFKKYKLGITPNPDIDCNEKIKFPLLIIAAKKAGIATIATGHYARVKKKGKKYELHRGKDESKDQSYFLYRQNQSDLSHTIFPIGEMTKKEVRKIAEKNGFHNAYKKSTVGICFIGKINLKEFLKKKIRPKKGQILDPEGKVIGEHDGVYYYTIGQRLGPRYGFEVDRENPTKRMKKWYVAKKDIKTNTLTAAPENHPILFRKEVVIKNLHLIDMKKEEMPKKVFSRIRQVGELLPSEVSIGKGKLKITLNKAITGVSEGQAIVLYSGTKCLGGGVISFGN